MTHTFGAIDELGEEYGFRKVRQALGVKAFGVNVIVMPPHYDGVFHYHDEQDELYFVHSGTARVEVDDEERLLGPWDFFHCPIGTEHVFVGAGDGPSVILMAGARTKDEQLLYPVSELAARYGASAEKETPDPREAYARFERATRGRPSYWDRLPWA